MKITGLLLGTAVQANEDSLGDIVYTGCQALALKSLPGFENVDFNTDGSACEVGQNDRALTTARRWTEHRNETTGKWIVPYYFADGYEALNYDGHTGAVSMQGIRDHVAHFEELTCIQMKEITSDEFATYTNRIRVFWDHDQSSNCASYVGRVFTGDQTMWMRPDCYTWNSGTTTNHEFMHALGFKHEHVRPDRDDHVVIHANVATNGNYVKMPTSSWEDVTSPYDFNSILHYYPSWQGDAYSIGLPPNGVDRPPVSRTYPFSEQDIAQLIAAYPCDVSDPCDPNPCPSGQICGTDYWGNAECSCPDGQIMDYTNECKTLAGMYAYQEPGKNNYAGLDIRGGGPKIYMYDTDGNDIVVPTAYWWFDYGGIVADVEECDGGAPTNCTVYNNVGSFIGDHANLYALNFPDAGNYRLRYSYMAQGGARPFPDIWVISDEFVVLEREEAPRTIELNELPDIQYDVPFEVKANLYDENGANVDFGTGDTSGIVACLELLSADDNSTSSFYYHCTNSCQYGAFKFENITFSEADDVTIQSAENATGIPEGTYFFRVEVIELDGMGGYYGVVDINSTYEDFSELFDLENDGGNLCHQVCHPNAVCDPAGSVFGTPACVCSDGYEGDGVDYCIMAINECEFDACPSDQICVDRLIGFECNCRRGFEKMDNECFDIDECSIGIHACDVGTSCENSVGGHLCKPDAVSCEPECEDGYQCDLTSGTCVDIDECAEDTHDCKDFETCRNGNGKFFCDFDNSQCRADLPRPEWKGRNGMKYMYRSEGGAVMALKLKNKFNRVNVRNELYTGVVMFTKDVCGTDFLRSLSDGRVQIELSDTSALYRIHDAHFKSKQKYTASGFTFDLLSVELKDMPWTFKSGVATKNMGSDIVYVTLTGLDTVEFLTTEDDCLLTAAQAALPYEDFSELDRACFVDLKTFWQKPVLP